MGRLLARLKRLEEKFGTNGGPPCSCLSIGSRDRLYGMLCGSEDLLEVKVVKEDPCNANIHYYEPEYKSASKPDDEDRVDMLEWMFDDDIPYPEPNVATTTEEYQAERWARLESDEETISAEEMMAKEVKRKTPAQQLIVDRINKLRPAGLDPADDDERWLKLPTDV